MMMMAEVKETTELQAAADCCPICYEDYEDNIDLELAASAAALDHDDSSSFLKQRIAIAAYHHHHRNDHDSSRSTGDDEKKTTSSSSSCQHAFCRACLRDYCQHAILTRQIPIPCPARTSTITSTSTTTSTTLDHSSVVTKKSKLLLKKSSAAPRRIVHHNSGGGGGGCRAILPDALIREVLRESSSSSSSTSTSFPAQSTRRQDDDEQEEEEEKEEVAGDDDINNMNLVDKTGNNDDADGNSNNNNNPYWVKYQRLQQLARDPSLVACPLCNELVGRGPGQSYTDDDEEDASSTAATSSASWLILRRFCYDCNLEFCAQHGHLLHAPNAAACASYTRRLQQLEQQHESYSSEQQEHGKTEQVLRAYTKPCSHCGCRLQKFAGCDHVVCPACQQDMCFRCGTHVYLSSPVKRGGGRRTENNNNEEQQQQPQQTNSMYRKCSKCQQDFIDHRYAHRQQWLMLLSLPLYLPFMIIYTVIVGLIIMPLTCFFCCCCGCGRLVENEPLAQTSSPRRIERREANDGAAAAANGNRDGTDDTTPQPALSPMRGIRLATCFIFVPFLVVLHDFGWESDFVDELYDNPQQQRQANNNDKVSEIPTMELEVSASTPSSSNNIDTTPADVDDLENVGDVVEC